MRKLFVFLCFVSAFLCNLHAANARLSAEKLFNKNKELWETHMLTYSEKAFAEENLQDKGFINQQKRLCRQIQKFAKQENIDLCVSASDYDYITGQYCAGEQSICDNLSDSELVYINFAWVNKGFEKYRYIINDIGKEPFPILIVKGVKTPLLFSRAISSICYPVDPQRTFIYWSDIYTRHGFQYLDEEWSGRTMVGSMGEPTKVRLWGPKAEDGWLALKVFSYVPASRLDMYTAKTVTECIDEQSGNKIKKTGCHQVPTEMRVPDNDLFYTEKDLNSPGCREFALHADRYTSSHATIKDALTDCMNTVANGVLCDRFIRFAAHVTYAKFSNNADMQIKEIVGDNLKLYTKDRKFYIDYDNRLNEVIDQNERVSYPRGYYDTVNERYNVNLYETSTGKKIGTCAKCLDGDVCKITDERYRKFLFSYQAILLIS